MTYTKTDHNTFLRACADPRATEHERQILGYAAALAAAGESVSRDEYLHAQALVGGALSTITPIFDR